MHFLKTTFRASPFIGILGLATDKFALIPDLQEKENKGLQECLEVPIINCSISSTNLIGSYCVGNSKGIIAPKITDKHEVKFLESKGIKVKLVGDDLALGNLVALNDHGILASELLSKAEVKAIKEFFNLPVLHTNLSGNELVGSLTKVSNTGFVVGKASAFEVEELTKLFKVKGKITTLNYGDIFAGNSMIVNKFGVVVGSNTSSHELIRVDEAFSGDTL